MNWEIVVSALIGILVGVAGGIFVSSQNENIRKWFQELPQKLFSQPDRLRFAGNLIALASVVAGLLFTWHGIGGPGWAEIVPAVKQKFDEVLKGIVIPLLGWLLREAFVALNETATGWKNLVARLPYLVRQGAAYHVATKRTSGSGHSGRAAPSPEDCILAEAELRAAEHALLGQGGSTGSGGINIVDASVSDYVQFIGMVVERSKDIRMTCTVRPYWFVTDGIQGVSLPPYIPSNNEYGKAEHLRFFSKQADRSYVRYLVVDEHMLAEMLLTVWIDMKHISSCNYQSGSPCKICGRKGSGSGTQGDENILPEIQWFRQEVNEGRGVSLYYTFVRRSQYAVHVGGKDAPLADRVYAHDLEMDVRFTFTSLEEGILRFRSNKKGGCQGLLKLEQRNFNQQVRGMADVATDKLKVTDGQDDPNNGHKFYRTFRALLVHALDLPEVRQEMCRHLEYLKALVEHSKSPSGSVYSSLGFASANDYNNFADLVCGAAEELEKNLCPTQPQQQSIADQIIQCVEDHFKKNCIPERVWVVVPEYQSPVRKATWRDNWDLTLRGGQASQTSPSPSSTPRSTPHRRWLARRRRP